MEWDATQGEAEWHDCHYDQIQAKDVFKTGACQIARSAWFAEIRLWRGFEIAVPYLPVFETGAVTPHDAMTLR